jgi:hypothetical protein
MGKGFKLTAIDSQSQIKRATELWGPYGQGWGLNQIDFQLLPLKDVTGIVCKAVFFYHTYDAADNVPECFEFPIAADMAYDPSKDCVKKLQTECISKALSRLGFNSDVFEGKFDDNKYVEQMRKEFAEPKVESTPASGVPGGPATSTPEPPAEVKTHGNTKAAKIPDPDPVAAQLLGKLAQEYTSQTADGFFVDYKKLCRVVYEKYGAYPTKESSLAKIQTEIKLDQIITRNDFLDGL